MNLLGLLVALYVGYASAGGAMVINAYIDRDIDILMNRTKKRASVGTDAINPPEKIVLFGGTLVFTSIGLAFAYFNPLTAVFVAFGVFFYLIGYSLYLKRHSILNNIIGGLASPVPVWVAYAAIEDTKMLLNWEAWLLGILVFVWTPSHTWALASKYHEDYRNAKIPVLPALYGLKITARVTFLWIFLVVGYAVALSFVMSQGSPVPLLLLILPNLWLIYSGYRFLRDPIEQTAYRCFKTHNIWLAITFVVIGALAI